MLASSNHPSEHVQVLVCLQQVANSQCRQSEFPGHKFQHTLFRDVTQTRTLDYQDFTSKREDLYNAYYYYTTKKFLLTLALSNSLPNDGRKNGCLEA